MDYRSQRKRRPASLCLPPSLIRRGVGTVCSSNRFPPNSTLSATVDSPACLTPALGIRGIPTRGTARTSRSQRTVVGQYFQRE